MALNHLRGEQSLKSWGPIVKHEKEKDDENSLWSFIKSQPIQSFSLIYYIKKGHFHYHFCMRREELIAATSPVSCTADSYTEAKEEGKEFPFHIHHPCHPSVGCTTGSGAEERPLHGHFIANRRRFSVRHTQKTMVRRFSALPGSQRKTNKDNKGFRPHTCNMKSIIHKLLLLFCFCYTKPFSRGCKAQRPAYSFRDWNESDFTEVGRCSPLAGNLTLHRFMPRDIRARTSVFSREEAVRSPFSIVEATKHCASERERERTQEVVW